MTAETNIMNDVPLLPLPSPPCRGKGWEPQYREADMRTYTRANVAHAIAPLQAEIDALRTRLEDTVRDSTNKIEAMRAEVARRIEAFADRAEQLEAHAERLAEALRESAQHLRNHADNEYQMRFEDNSPSGRLNRLLMLADRIEANAARAALGQETTNG